MKTRREFLTAGSAAAVGLAVFDALAQQQQQPRQQQQVVDPNQRTVDPNAADVGESRAPRYKACIIGSTGRGGYGHSMEVVFNHRRDVRVVGLSDPDRRGREEAAKKSSAARTYSDYREMLEREKPNLVSIGTRWSVEHRDIALACAAAGAHVYMEKPVAPNLKHADAMVEAFDSRNLKCAVAHQMRIAPVIRELKKQIDAGLLGTVLEYRGRGKEDARSGGEDLMVLGTHVMDLMRWFAGHDPLWCSARVTVNGRDIVMRDNREATEQLGRIAGDTVHATYAFKDGVMGYFASQKNKENGGNRFGLSIYGTQGVANLELGGALDVRILREPSWRTVPNGKTWEPLQGFGDPNDSRRGAEYLNALAIDDLIESIQRNRRPFLSIHDARAGLEMTLAPYAAALSGGRVTFPLKDREHPLAPGT